MTCFELSRISLVELGDAHKDITKLNYYSLDLATLTFCITLFCLMKGRASLLLTFDLPTFVDVHTPIE